MSVPILEMSIRRDRKDWLLLCRGFFALHLEKRVFVADRVVSQPDTGTGTVCERAGSG